MSLLAALSSAMAQQKVGEIENQVDTKAPSFALPLQEGSFMLVQVKQMRTGNLKSTAFFAQPNFKFGDPLILPNKIGVQAVGVLSNQDLLIAGRQPISDLEKNGRKDLFQYGVGRVDSAGKLAADLSLKVLDRITGGMLTRLDNLNIEPNGRLLATTNEKATPEGRALLTQFLPSGEIDDGFAKKMINRPGDFLVLPDGKILVALSYKTKQNTLQRLLPGGEVDTTFAPGVARDAKGGRRRRVVRQGAGLAGQISYFLRQPDGKLLVAGILHLPETDLKCSLIRLNEDGSVDPAFTPVEARERNGGSLTFVQSLVLQADGKILLNGSFKILDSERTAGFARLLPNGDFDKTFSPPKSIETGMFVLQPNGRILVGNKKIYRLTNDPAKSVLSGKPDTGYQWMRGGSAPEIERAFLEIKNEGQWSFHSEMQRIEGGWKSTQAVSHENIRACGVARGSLQSHFYTIVKEP